MVGWGEVTSFAGSLGGGEAGFSARDDAHTGRVADDGGELAEGGERGTGRAVDHENCGRGQPDSM